MPLTERLPKIANPRQLSVAGLKAFFRLSELWGLDTEQQMTLLGQPKRSTFFEWKKNPERELSVDTLERLSYLMGIYKALQILFPDPRIADGWVKVSAQVPPFGGKTPLAYLLRGPVAALYEVRRYLDAQRGAW
jgi:hypothetical protein